MEGRTKEAERLETDVDEISARTAAHPAPRAIGAPRSSRPSPARHPPPHSKFYGVPRRLPPLSAVRCPPVPLIDRLRDSLRSNIQVPFHCLVYTASYHIKTLHRLPLVIDALNVEQLLKTPQPRRREMLVRPRPVQ